MFSPTVVTAAGAALIALLLHRILPALLRLWRRYVFARSLPGPSAGPPVGQGLLDYMVENRRRYGAVFGIWYGLDVVVHVCDPDLIRTVLSSSVLTHKSPNYDLMRPWLGNGLLTSSGSEWHQRRKLLTPAFHFQILGTFKGPMEECCDILVGRLASVADGEQSVDVYQYVTLFALDVICETAMGIKVNAQLNQESQFVKATQTICAIIHRQIFGGWKRIPLLFALTADGRARTAALRILHGETRRVIQHRRATLEADEESRRTAVDDAGEIDVDATPAKRRVAFLDSLLLLQQQTRIAAARDGSSVPPLTDQHIQEEVDTFMFEGHDTTSSALSFALLLLAGDARVQQLAYEEAHRLGGMHDANQSMPYLEAVIKETLRLYPSVAWFSRKTVQPFQLGELTVPADIGIAVMVYPLQRDPLVYAEPERYWPERFLESPEDGSAHPYAHIAFSAGPRNCIGQRFAMLELKCTLSRLLREFEWLPVVGFRPNVQPHLVLKSTNGVQVRLRRRVQ